MAELPEKLMSCRFLPMSCWFIARGADRLEGIAPLKQRECIRCRDAWRLAVSVPRPLAWSIEHWS